MPVQQGDHGLWLGAGHLRFGDGQNAAPTGNIQSALTGREYFTRYFGMALVARVSADWMLPVGAAF